MTTPAPARLPPGSTPPSWSSPPSASASPSASAPPSASSKPSASAPPSASTWARAGLDNTVAIINNAIKRMSPEIQHRTIRTTSTSVSHQVKGKRRKTPLQRSEQDMIFHKYSKPLILIALTRKSK
ncbi:MAG: hypothetical protein CMJ77_13270 [Planctomycetaceae bacterium]|nr:hypothetical protein [Planctomycetaceae bacterium]